MIELRDIRKTFRVAKRKKGAGAAFRSLFRREYEGGFILGAAVCFFTVDGLEFINIFTDGGRELASYPLPIYGKWIRRFFTFIIPFGCMNYLPLMYLTGRAMQHQVLYMITPLLGILFIFPCLLVWKLGVRHYASTGS